MPGVFSPMANAGAGVDADTPGRFSKRGDRKMKRTGFVFAGGLLACQLMATGCDDRMYYDAQKLAAQAEAAANRAAATNSILVTEAPSASDGSPIGTGGSTGPTGSTDPGSTVSHGNGKGPKSSGADPAPENN